VLRSLFHIFGGGLTEERLRGDFCFAAWASREAAALIRTRCKTEKPPAEVEQSLPLLAPQNGQGKVSGSVGSTAGARGRFAIVSILPRPATSCHLPQPDLKPRHNLRGESRMLKRHSAHKYCVAWAELLL